MGRRESPAEAWERMRNASPPTSAPAPAWDPPPTPSPRPPAQGNGDGGASRSYWEREPAQQPRETSDGQSGSDLQDASPGELVHRLTDQTKTLVKQEMRLAQVELKEKGKKAGIGIGMFGASGLVAFFGVAVLLAAIVLGLSTVIDAWLAALIVGVVLLGAAAASALMGKKKIEQATPPAPEQAMTSVKRDVDTVKRSARR